MNKWSDNFNYDPIKPLLAHNIAAVSLSARKYLLDEKIDLKILWEDREALKIVRRQKPDGSWRYPGAIERIRSQENYDQLETYRNLGYLVEQYGFTKKHPAINSAAEFLFGFQSKEGDIRGIYGNQYSPNYTAGITELLIKAGYEKDPRIKKIFDWLISIRQHDGGWAIPIRTRQANLSVVSDNSATLEPDPSQPFSHMVTGVVLRAFAAHSKLRRSKEAQLAGHLLAGNLFKRDNYPDRGSEDFWTGFTFPFWFTDLASAMDSISLLNISTHEPTIDKAIIWFIRQQKPNGLWEPRVLKGKHRELSNAWISLSICRIFKRLCGDA